MERILCLAVGYLFGLFQTGYIYSKLHHVDIRKEGSGNAGSTNVLRVMGVKAGATVFLGDFFKTLIPCILVRHFFQNQPEMVNLLVLYTAFGVILGHNYPFYMGFKGGKGIAATAGLLVAMDLRVTAVFICISRNRGSDTLCVSWLFGSGNLIPDRHGIFRKPRRLWTWKPVSDGILSGFSRSNADGILETPLEYWPPDPWNREQDRK